MKSPAFQFYPGDWLGSQRVQLMSLDEEGAYFRLLCYCWLHGSIPAEPAQVAKLIGKGASTTLATTVLTMFQAHGDKLVHDRLEAEREKQAMWRAKSRIGGLKSAETRAKSRVKRRVVKPPFQGSLENGSNQNPTLPSSSSSSDHMLGAGPEFLEHQIYDAYPRKESRATGIKAIKKIIDAQPIFGPTLLERTQAYAAAVLKWPEQDRKYIPLAATWFNGERYNDDPQNWTRNADNRKTNSRGFEQAGSYAGVTDK